SVPPTSATSTSTPASPPTPTSSGRAWGRATLTRSPLARPSHSPTTTSCRRGAAGSIARSTSPPSPTTPSSSARYGSATPAARPPPPPEHHLPERARAALRGELHRDGRRGDPAGGLVGDRGRVSPCRHRLRRRHHPPQPEPEWRDAVDGSRRCDRSAAPPDARAAGRDPPDQGQLRVPLRSPGARRGGDRG